MIRLVIGGLILLGVVVVFGATLRDVFGGLFTGWSREERARMDAATRYAEWRRQNPESARREAGRERDAD